jgi:hypothetical protein
MLWDTSETLKCILPLEYKHINVEPDRTYTNGQALKLEFIILGSFRTCLNASDSFVSSRNEMGVSSQTVVP